MAGVVLFALSAMAVAAVATIIAVAMSNANLRQRWNAHLRPRVQPPRAAADNVRRRDAASEAPRVRAMLPPRPGRGAAIAVERDRRPLWEVRGWRQRGNILIGAFRTPRGSFAGEISLATPTRPEFFIVNPPPALLKGSHGSCFRSRGGGKYYVHWGLASPDIDAGIVGIEKLIAEAL